MNRLPKGPYGVGFTDTVIFDSEDWFKFKNDSIKKPIWIQIWYPTNQKGLQPMAFSNYFSVQCNALPANWKKVFFDGVQQAIWVDLLKVKRDSLGVFHPLETQKKAWNDLSKSKVKVHPSAPIAPGSFPVIIYRHGAQSVPFDNHMACEHWASLGYIVASAWYNWPSDWAPDFPLIDRPIDTVIVEDGIQILTQKQTYLADLFRVGSWMKHFPNVKESGWVGVGHSMGAQRWLEYDFSAFPKLVDRIISLHTTAESDGRTDLENGHQNLLPLVNGGAKYAKTKTYVLAPKNPFWYGKKTNLSDTLDDPGFLPFRQNPFTPYQFIAGPYVDHNAFISWLPWLAHLGKYSSGLFSKEDEMYYNKNWNHYREVLLICDEIISPKHPQNPFKLPRRVKKSWRSEAFNH